MTCKVVTGAASSADPVMFASLLYQPHVAASSTPACVSLSACLYALYCLQATGAPWAWQESAGQATSAPVNDRGSTQEV
jgi:hypothetical protein